MLNQQWRVSRKIGSPKKWVSKNNPVRLKLPDKVAIHLIDDNSFWQSTLDAYFVDILLPEMARVWEQGKDNPRNYPQTLKDTTTSSDAQSRALPNSGGIATGQVKYQPRNNLNLRQEEARKTMGQGFDDLFAALTTKVQIGETGLGIGPMEDVLKLKLSRYMPHSKGSTSTTSEYNTLFYAIEYGTGMLAGAENGSLGSPSFIRTEGPTKDPRPQFRGSWWLGPKPGRGIHWMGQQGTHFLFDARSRDPQEHWQQFLLDTLPKFFKTRLNS